MAKKLTYEEVKHFIEVESGSGCKLLSKEYLGSKNKILLECKCGNNFETTFNIFKHKNKYTCDNCTKEKMINEMKHDYNHIKECISLQGCTLLSKEYINQNTPLTIKCKCGNIFKRDFATFKRSPYCEECSGRINWNYKKVKRFVEEESNSNCKLLSEKYKNYSTKMIFECTCGEAFKTTFAKFKDRNKRQCNKCSNKEKWDYEKALHMIQENSKCELLNDEDDYFSSNTKLKLRCHCESIFTVYPRHFINENKRECYKCKISKSRTGGRLFYEEVKHYIEVESDSGCKLITSKGEYIDAQQKLKIQCKCGNTFDRSYAVFQRGSFECRACSSKISNGESIILGYLNENNVIYKTEYWFDDLRSNKGKPLQFDFGIFSNNKLLFLIEYDGQQHYQPVNFGGISDKEAKKNFNITTYHDELKNKHCKENDIPLLRIPYWEFDNIEHILEEWLEKYGVIHKNKENIA